MQKLARSSPFLLPFLSCRFILAQTADTPTNPVPIQAGDHYVPSNWLSWQELGLSIIVLLFGMYVVTLQYRLLKAASSRADESLRALTVTLIVVISLALVSSGYGKEQITPVLGLFGTIIGYLLGATNSRSTSAQTTEKESKANDPPVGA